MPKGSIVISSPTTVKKVESPAKRPTPSVLRKKFDVAGTIGDILRERYALVLSGKEDEEALNEIIETLERHGLRTLGDVGDFISKNNMLSLQSEVPLSVLLLLQDTYTTRIGLRADLAGEIEGETISTPPLLWVLWKKMLADLFFFYEYYYEEGGGPKSYWPTTNQINFRHEINARISRANRESYEYSVAVKDTKGVIRAEILETVGMDSMKAKHVIEDLLRVNLTKSQSRFFKRNIFEEEMKQVVLKYKTGKGHTTEPKSRAKRRERGRPLVALNATSISRREGPDKGTSDTSSTEESEEEEEVAKIQGKPGNKQNTSNSAKKNSRRLQEEHHQRTPKKLHSDSEIQTIRITEVKPTPLAKGVKHKPKAKKNLKARKRSLSSTSPSAPAQLHGSTRGTATRRGGPRAALPHTARQLRTATKSKTRMEEQQREKGRNTHRTRERKGRRNSQKSKAPRRRKHRSASSGKKDRHVRRNHTSVAEKKRSKKKKRDRGDNAHKAEGNASSDNSSPEVKQRSATPRARAHAVCCHSYKRKEVAEISPSGEDKDVVASSVQLFRQLIWFDEAENQVPTPEVITPPREDALPKNRRRYFDKTGSAGKVKYAQTWSTKQKRRRKSLAESGLVIGQPTNFRTNEVLPANSIGQSYLTGTSATKDKQEGSGSVASLIRRIPLMPKRTTSESEITDIEISAPTMFRTVNSTEVSGAGVGTHNNSVTTGDSGGRSNKPSFSAPLVGSLSPLSTAHSTAAEQKDSMTSRSTKPPDAPSRRQKKNRASTTVVLPSRPSFCHKVVTDTAHPSSSSPQHSSVSVPRLSVDAIPRTPSRVRSARERTQTTNSLPKIVRHRRTKSDAESDSVTKRNKDTPARKASDRLRLSRGVGLTQLRSSEDAPRVQPALQDDELVIRFFGMKDIDGGNTSHNIRRTSIATGPYSLTKEGRLDDNGTTVSRFKVHKGFYRIYKQINRQCLKETGLDLVDTIVGKAQMASSDKRIVFTGHSMGACLSVIAAFQLITRFPALKGRLFVLNFGTPKYARNKFAEWVSENLEDHLLLIELEGDPTVKLPPAPLWGWQAPGPKVIITHPSITEVPKKMSVHFLYWPVLRGMLKGVWI